MQAKTEHQKENLKFYNLLIRKNDMKFEEFSEEMLKIAKEGHPGALYTYGQGILSGF